MLPCGREVRIYEGIFRDEVCISFLRMCVRAVHNMFGELHSRCAEFEAEGGTATFKVCVHSVSEWDAARFDGELELFRRDMPAAEECFRSTFIAFVRAYYHRPGRAQIRVKLNIPRFGVFFECFIRCMIASNILLSGCFFDQDRSLLATESCMNAIRDVLLALLPHHVSVAEDKSPPAATAPQEQSCCNVARSEPQARVPEEDEIEACDSISNAHSKFRRVRPPLGSGMPRAAFAPTHAGDGRTLCTQLESREGTSILSSSLPEGGSRSCSSITSGSVLTDSDSASEPSESRGSSSVASTSVAAESRAPVSASSQAGSDRMPSEVAAAPGAAVPREASHSAPMSAVELAQ